MSIPVVFVIENNRYAYSTPTDEQFAPGTELWRRAAAYGIEGLAIECGSPADAAATLGAVIAKVRSTSRPMLVEARTLRLRGHAAYDTCSYLRPGEADEFAAMDALPAFRRSLAARAGAARVDAIDAELGAFVEECVKVAMAVRRPDPAGHGVAALCPCPAALRLAARARCARERDDGPGPQPRASQGACGAARVDRARPGHRDLRRRLQGHREPLRRVRAGAGSSTRRSPRARAPGTPSGWRSTGTGRSRSSSSRTSRPRPSRRSPSTPPRCTSAPGPPARSS